MRYLILALLFIGVSSSFQAPIEEISVNAVNSNVFICNGPYSTKYHYKKTCRGLSNCSTDIEEVSLVVAKDKGRTLCGREG